MYLYVFRGVIRARTLFRLHDGINRNNPRCGTLPFSTILIYLVEDCSEMFGATWEYTLFRLNNRVPLPTTVTYKKDKFLCNAVSSPQDCSKRFTLHPLANLFIPRPFQLLWEAFSHAAITARRLLFHISTTTYCIAKNCGNVGLSNLPKVRKDRKGFETGFSRLSVQHSNRYVIAPHMP